MVSFLFALGFPSGGEWPAWKLASTGNWRRWAFRWQNRPFSQNSFNFPDFTIYSPLAW
jgi:hypothetical protein